MRLTHDEKFSSLYIQPSDRTFFYKKQHVCLITTDIPVSASKWAKKNVILHQQSIFVHSIQSKCSIGNIYIPRTQLNDHFSLIFVKDHLRTGGSKKGKIRNCSKYFFLALEKGPKNVPKTAKNCSQKPYNFYFFIYCIPCIPPIFYEGMRAGDMKIFQNIAKNVPTPKKEFEKISYPKKFFVNFSYHSYL